MPDQMKPVIASLLLLAASAFMADARDIAAQRFEELEKNSDLIVIARPTQPKKAAN